MLLESPYLNRVISANDTYKIDDIHTTRSHDWSMTNGSESKDIQNKFAVALFYNYGF